jgi:hypothetical protein
VTYKSEFDRRMEEMIAAAQANFTPKSVKIYSQGNDDSVHLVQEFVPAKTGTDAKDTSARLMQAKEAADLAWSKLHAANAKAFFRVFATYDDQELYQRKLTWGPGKRLDGSE